MITASSQTIATAALAGGTSATSAVSVDTLTGGAGGDVFTFGAALPTGLTGYSNTAATNGTTVDSITDFVSGTDKIALGGLASGPAVVTAASGAAQTAANGVPAGTGQLAAAANAVLAIDNKAGAGGGVGGSFGDVFAFQGSNYLVVDSNNSGTFNTGDYLVNVGNVANIKKTDFS